MPRTSAKDPIAFFRFLTLPRVLALSITPYPLEN